MKADFLPLFRRHLLAWFEARLADGRTPFRRVEERPPLLTEGGALPDLVLCINRDSLLAGALILIPEKPDPRDAAPGGDYGGGPRADPVHHLGGPGGQSLAGHRRGGHAAQQLANEDGEEKRKEKAREREDARQRGDEEKLDELNAAYTSVNDLTKVEGLNDPGFLRPNEIDLGQTFTVRTSFFSLVITARRDTFLRQQRLVLERHAAGCITHEAEVRAGDMADVPSEGAGTADGSAPPPGT